MNGEKVNANVSISEETRKAIRAGIESELYSSTGRILFLKPESLIHHPHKISHKGQALGLRPTRVVA
jgi:hypothetical protein